MECESCFASIKNAVSTLPGFQSIVPDMKQELVSIEGNVAPSAVVRAIQGLGKDAIVRGTGRPDSAAVAILETFYKNTQFSSKHSVKGLVRIVSVSPVKTLFDLTVSGVDAGTYYASIRTSGCLVDGPLSTGSQYAELGPVEVVKSKDGNLGQAYFMRKINVADIIGRSITISKTQIPDQDSIVGVIARSAGVWQNDKTVCSCTGKTVWEERKDAVEKGVL